MRRIQATAAQAGSSPCIVINGEILEHIRQITQKYDDGNFSRVKEHQTIAEIRLQSNRD